MCSVPHDLGTVWDLFSFFALYMYEQLTKLPDVLTNHSDDTSLMFASLACSTGVFWAGESCLFMFVLLKLPSLMLSWRKIRESKNSNP